jgi:hypothetical protein
MLLLLLLLLLPMLPGTADFHFFLDFHAKAS